MINSKEEMKFIVEPNTNMEEGCFGCSCDEGNQHKCTCVGGYDKNFALSQK